MAWRQVKLVKQLMRFRSSACVVEPAVADAFWEAAALFASRLPSGRLGVDTLFRLGSRTALEAVAAFFLESSLLWMIEPRPYSEVVSLGGFLGLEGV